MEKPVRLFGWMVLLAWAAGLALTALSPVSVVFAAPAGQQSPVSGEVVQQTTPVPENTSVNPPRTGSPILGILVLLAPAGWLVWKSSQDKQLKKRKAAA